MTERPDTVPQKIWDSLNDNLKAKVIEHERRHEEIMAAARSLTAKTKGEQP
jgi:hypothetical protein